MECHPAKCQQSLGVTCCVSKEATPQELSVKPSLWLVVDPNLVLQCNDVSTLPSESFVSDSYKAPVQEKMAQPAASDYINTEDSEEDPLISVSELYAEDDPPYTPISLPAHAPRCKGRKAHGRKVHVRRSLSQYESWPRPPINYCNLISLALKNSKDGHLNVQQIYSFVRDHFPFFRVAPDGWKNTVRHNLCFSSSFEKITGWGCVVGHRRSCLWKLTCQGCKKFCTEMQALSDELLRRLRRSMNRPDCSFPAALLEEAHNLELLGVKAAESGDLKTALQKFSKAIELLPDRASAYNNRAQALRLQGDVTGALEDLNHALELSRGKGVAGRQALVQRGLILRLNGNEEAAKNDFHRAAEQGSDFAKQQLILLNPYAALCNRMLRDMIQNLCKPDP